MAALNLLERPNFIIGGVGYADDEIWDFLNRDGLQYSTTDPLVTLKLDPVRPNVDGRTIYVVDNHPEYKATARQHFELPPDIWIFQPMKGYYFGYGVTEDYFNRWFLKGGKYLGLRIQTSGATKFIPFGKIDSGFSIGSDFLPGAIATVAIAASAHYLGEALTGGGFVGPTGGEFVGPTNFELATSGEFVGPTNFELATGGMGAGMGTGGVIPTGAVQAGSSSFTLADIAAGAKTAAGIAASAATVVKTAASVSNAGVDWGNVKDAAKNAADIAAAAERAKLSLDNLTSDPKTMLYIGAAILAVMVIG